MKTQFLLAPVTGDTTPEEMYQKWLEAKRIIRLRQMTPEQAAALMSGLELENHEDFKAVCAEALGMMKHQEALPLLVKRAADSSDVVRMEIISALARINGAEATGAIIKMMFSDPKLLLRNKAAQVLWQMAPRETAEEALLKALGGKDSTVKWSAEASLGEMGSERAVQPLIDLLEDSEYMARKKAVLALGFIKARKAIPALEKMAEDSGEEDELRQIAQETIKSITAY